MTLHPKTVTADQIKGPSDVTLLGVKSYAFESGMNDFASALGPKTMILPMLNGMRHMDLLAARFGAHAGALENSLRRWVILVATPQYLTRYGSPESPDDLNRHRAVVLVERGSVQPWTFGSKRVIPTGVFRTSDIEQMRMGVLEHLGIAQAPAWLFAQN